MQARTTWLSDAEKNLVYDEALLVLERVGLRMAGSQHLARLREAGASVDEETAVVRFPAELVDRLRRQCPREIVMAGAAPEDDVVLREGGMPRFRPPAAPR